MATKKAAVKLKASPSKPQMSKDLATNKAVSEAVNEEARAAAQAVALQSYEQALRLLQSQKFDKAKPLFEKVIASGPKELADRATIHLSICVQQLSRAQAEFSSVEEHYDYAISLMNMGDFVTAREHLEEIASQSPKLDFIWYGLSVLECLTGRTNESLQHLSEAVRLNPSVRFQARNDSDFRNMADDPRFTELLYPEGSTA
jgi:tetratricopeptide (TPR) repeat protein